ncbi:PulJ/GspJ family protein [Solicola sp. PLA-1-18]|uniref:PulJ/GspJ family protein n=1 Tax=Solicola sp. PLA-1-18 TaxID=3380532 RepID=UPI003B76C6E1
MTTHRNRRIDLRDDAGTTLMELIVAMALLTVFMGIFTTVTVMMTQASTKVQSISDAVDQGNTGFLNLDRTVRYATGISTPTRTPSTGIWHVELSSREQGDGTSTDKCTQLRVSLDGRLQVRTWAVASDGSLNGSASAWRVLASKVTNGSVAEGSDDRPFRFPASSAAAAAQYQRLTVLAVTRSGSGSSASSHRTLTTFTALNSTQDTNPATVCTQASLKDAT